MFADSEDIASPIGAFRPAHELFGSRKLRLAPRPSARVVFGSRKLRLAPQDYSLWTPPSDRFLVRASPHPREEGVARALAVGATFVQRGADQDQDSRVARSGRIATAG